jgi:hypothetical protein
MRRQGAILLVPFLLLLGACGASDYLGKSECSAIGADASDTIMSMVEKPLPKGILILEIKPRVKVNVLFKLVGQQGEEVNLKTEGGIYEVPAGQHYLLCDDVYYISDRESFTISEDKCTRASVVPIEIEKDKNYWGVYSDTSTIAKMAIGRREQWILYRWWDPGARARDYIQPQNVFEKDAFIDEVQLQSRNAIVLQKHSQPPSVYPQAVSDKNSKCFVLHRVLTRDCEYDDPIECAENRLAGFYWKTVCDQEMNEELWENPGVIPGIPTTFVQQIRNCKR